MTKEAFVSKKFAPKSLETIARASAIIADYQAQGFVLTLRQLYYQFVARGLIANTMQEYNKLGAVISDARLAGLIDWEALEDRTRYLRKESTWATPRDILEACASQYKQDAWDSQETRVEVWVEKDALVGVIEPACSALRLPYFACRGYASQSAIYEAALRYRNWINAGQSVIVLHLGDHDPSGIDMTRDNLDRLHLFLGDDADQLQVERLALNIDQVRHYNPPPNPTKLTDARAAGYLLEFGESSWELDALDPRVIDGLIRNAVDNIYDETAFEQALAEEREQRLRIQVVARGFE